jgi:hypothetical protein
MSEEQNWKTIRKKLEREPGPGFDQRFWAKFESEFGADSTAAQHPFRKWVRSLLEPAAALKWAPLMTLLVVAAAVWSSRQTVDSPLQLTSSFTALMLEPEEVEMLEQLDWIDSVEESDAEAIADASDEEWGSLQ